MSLRTRAATQCPPTLLFCRFSSPSPGVFPFLFLLVCLFLFIGCFVKLCTGNLVEAALCGELALTRPASLGISARPTSLHFRGGSVAGWLMITWALESAFVLPHYRVECLGMRGHHQLPAARYGIHFYDQVKPSLPAALLPLKELLKALTCHAGVPQGSHTYLLSHPGEKSLKSL